MNSKKSSRLAKNKLHGNLLCDIFEDNINGLNVVERFFKALSEGFNTINKQTYLVDEFFNEVTLTRTKLYFRQSLVFLIYCLVIQIAESGVLSPVPNELPAFTLFCVFCIYLGLYLITFRRLNYQMYSNLSLFICVLAVIVVCWVRCIIVRQNSILQTPLLGFIIMMCNLLPIKLELTVSITIILFSGFTMLDIHHAQSTGITLSEVEINPADKYPWIYFDTFKRLRNPNRFSKKSFPEIISDILILIMIFLICQYLLFWNTLRLKFVFYKLCKSVQARDGFNEALKTQIRWIESIMPSHVTSEYELMRKRNRDNVSSMWIYNKSFDNVSILFADIVGFTKMSSNKSAYQVVTLLNDLFNRFDELCRLTMCEKIGTLGDCYYCVAGCPVPHPNHASSCIEMGLGMCRIIKVFNCDHQESVSMRVGVHTGRVNAAIIGSQRFRFDVYSNDVLIANQMESSGRPGRVHISEVTYNEIKHLYNVSLGEDIFVKKEEMVGIAGMMLATKILKTYFVDPRSSKLRTKHEKFGENQLTLRSLSDVDIDIDQRFLIDLDSFYYLTSFRNYKISSTKTWRSERKSKIHHPSRLDKHAENIENLQLDIELIRSLRSDPEKQILLFQAPPIDPITYNFIDSETEWHYSVHTCYNVSPTYIDSIKITPLSDAFALIVINFILFLILIITHCNITNIEKLSLFIYLILNIISLICFMILLFISTVYSDQINLKYLRKIYLFLHHPINREIITGLFTLLPTFTYLNFRFSLHDDKVFISYLQFISLIEGFCILIHSLPISSSHWSRLIFSFITFLLIRLTIMELSMENYKFCMTKSELKLGIPIKQSRVFHLIELICYLLLVHILTKQTEHNVRLCFFVSREADIACDLAETAFNESQELLFNIIPKYVYHEIELSGQNENKFNYAVHVENVGVTFACITNFFSKYYREDYKGGENALKLLNTLICSFDNILNYPSMKDVEKIKTINDCYMVAAGLNKVEITKNPNKQTHLIALMEYCHLLKEELNKFNNSFIIGSDNFNIKIGYNFGPVMAGIIGTTKPLYDIWGDTVNVASRMYSTGIPGQVQVPSYVIPVLDKHFDFTYRGQIFVKGKGDMETYICTRKSDLI